MPSITRHGNKIAALLQEHQDGVTAKEAILRRRIVVDSRNRWKRRAAGMPKAVLVRLRAVEDASRRLKRLVGDHVRNIVVLTDALGTTR